MTTGEIPQKITMIAGIPQQSKSTGGYEPSKMKSTKLCSEQIRQRLLHSSYIYVRIYNYSCSHACITNSQLRVYIYIYILYVCNGSAKTHRVHEFYTPLQKQL